MIQQDPLWPQSFDHPDRRREIEIVLGVALPVILPLFFGLNGILCSMPLADILTFLITVAVILSIYRSLKQEETQLNAVRL